MKSIEEMKEQAKRDAKANGEKVIYEDSDSIVIVPKGNKGFAAMPSEAVRAIASKGGKAGHAQKKAHEWNSDEAREAGRKGGLAAAAKKRAERLAQGRVAFASPGDPE